MPCDGYVVDNYDGFPEKYCGVLDPAQERTFICEDCHAQGLCDAGSADDCAVVGVRNLTVHYLRETLWLCEPCYAHETDQNVLDARAEAAHERMLENFYGASTPQTIHEQYQAAAEQKRRLKG